LLCGERAIFLLLFLGKVEEFVIFDHINISVVANGRGEGTGEILHNGDKMVNVVKMEFYFKICFTSIGINEN
jgi:hypothetical protein